MRATQNPTNESRGTSFARVITGVVSVRVTRNTRFVQSTRNRERERVSEKGGGRGGDGRAKRKEPVVQAGRRNATHFADTIVTVAFYPHVSVRVLHEILASIGRTLLHSQLVVLFSSPPFPRRSLLLIAGDFAVFRTGAVKRRALSRKLAEIKIPLVFHEHCPAARSHRDM